MFTKQNIPGVGILYNAALPEFLQDNLHLVDYIEIIPDMFWSDEGRGSQPRFTALPQWQHQLNWLHERVPLVAHHIGMSLGTADFFDTEYISFIQEMHRRYNFLWHSDHLSFLKLPTKGPHDHNAGIAVPVPYDEEMLQMIAGKMNYICKEINLPFLLENNVYFVEYHEQDYTETDFINRLMHMNNASYILLDIHNLYANSVNQQVRAKEYIDALDMAKVLEMHIAGGNELDGTYMDSHSGPCPDEVWELLDYAVSKAPNLRGITFEFHESYFPLLQYDGLSHELGMAKKIRDKHYLKKETHEFA